MPTMAKPGCTAGMPSGPHCGQEMSTPQPADRCVAVFTAETGAAAGDLGADDGAVVGGAIAAGSDPLGAAGFGGEACDDTRGSCTTAITRATSSPATIKAPSSRHHLLTSGRIGRSTLQLRQHLRQLVEQLACEIAEPT